MSILKHLSTETLNKFLKLSRAYEATKNEPEDEEDVVADLLFNKNKEKKTLQKFVEELSQAEQAELLTLYRIGHPLETPETVTRRVYEATIKQKQADLVDDPIMTMGLHSGESTAVLIEKGLAKL